MTPRDYKTHVPPGDIRRQFAEWDYARPIREDEARRRKEADQRTKDAIRAMDLAWTAGIAGSSCLLGWLLRMWWAA